MTLISAFEPFGGASVNASLEAARLWAQADPQIALVELPVVAGAAEETALLAIDSLQPDLYLALGEAGATPWTVRLERSYFNVDDFRIPDNAGNQWRDRTIESDGPSVRYSTLDLPALAARIAERAPMPVVVSDDAGRFLCNHLAFALARARPDLPFAFIHVPAWRPESGAERLGEIVRTLIALERAAPGG